MNVRYSLIISTAILLKCIGDAIECEFFIKSTILFDEFGEFHDNRLHTRIVCVDRNQQNVFLWCWCRPQMTKCTQFG